VYPLPWNHPIPILPLAEKRPLRIRQFITGRRLGEIIGHVNQPGKFAKDSLSGPLTRGTYQYDRISVIGEQNLLARSGTRKQLVNSIFGFDNFNSVGHGGTPARLVAS
jgi:hypothetical protein